MRRFERARSGKQVLVALVLIALPLAGLSWCGCVGYRQLVHKGNDTYLVGGTSFLIFGVSWIRKCEERVLPSGRAWLYCYQMDVVEEGAGVQVDAHTSEGMEPKPIAPSAPRSGSQITRTATSQPAPAGEGDTVYWQTKCNNLVVTNKNLNGFAEKKKLMGVCLKRCEGGASFRLMACLRKANTEKDYQKCGELL